MKNYSLVLAVLLLCAGCIVTSDNPLSDPKDAKPDQSLLGAWSTLR